MNEEKITQNIYVQIPTVQYFIKTYDNSFSGILKSAAENFKRYESSEKYRRLQNELQAVAKDQVNENLCNQVMQIKRKQKYGSYANWAKILLLHLSQAKN